MSAEGSAGGWPSAPLALERGGIHLWISDYARIQDDALLRRYGGILEEHERRRQLGYCFADDRRRDLVTRALVRSVLSLYEPMEPQDWRFVVNEYGRPRVDSRTAQTLVFNIAHTRSLILLGVRRSGDLGVDIENTCVRAAPMMLASRCFAAAEARACTSLPGGQQAARFWDYWTLKESYIKARGLGLSLPLDGFSFDFQAGDSMSLEIAPALADEPLRWHFLLFAPMPGYVAAVCAQNTDAPLSVTLRAAVPLQSALNLPLSIRRSSGNSISRG